MSTENTSTIPSDRKKKSRLLTEFAPASYQEWREAAVALLKGAPFEKKLVTKTYEGITLQPIYMEQDIKRLDVGLNFPGFAPYVRGTAVSGYKVCTWNAAQQCRDALPQQLNAALRHIEKAVRFFFANPVQHPGHSN